MAIIYFDVAAFRSAFVQFADSTAYPDATLQGYWDTAIAYISNNSYGRMSLTARTRALNLMVAHIATLTDSQNAGFFNNGQGLVMKSKVPGMEFTLQPPPTSNHFNWWCGLTAYGTQLMALLRASASGGFLFTGAISPLGSLR